MRRGAVFAAALAFCATPCGTHAQGTIPDASECFAGIPESALVRVPVHLEAEAVDPTGRVVLPLVDALMERVASHVQRSLDAGSLEFPKAEPRITWRTLGRGIVLHVHSDGKLSWSASPADSGVRHGSMTGIQVLRDAMSAISDSGTRIILPDGLARDSLSFLIAYRVPAAREDGQMVPMRVRRAVSIFSLLVPPEQPAAAVRGPRIVYPPRRGQFDAQGTVVLRFVVDSRGRVERNTVEAYWPPDRPKLTGELGEYYRAFVVAARRGVAAMRFQPALLGGCPVRQYVELPIDFMIVP